MADVKVSAYSKLATAMRNMESAHAAIAANIASHAERHSLEMEAKRRALREGHAIKSGIERATGKI